MKRMKDLQKLKTSTMVWLTGLTIGLALVVAALVAMATGSDVALYWIHKRVISSHPAAPELVKTPRISPPEIEPGHAVNHKSRLLWMPVRTPNASRI